MTVGLSRLEQEVQLVGDPQRVARAHELSDEQPAEQRLRMDVGDAAVVAEEVVRRRQVVLGSAAVLCQYTFVQSYLLV